MMPCPSADATILISRRQAATTLLRSLTGLGLGLGLAAHGPNAAATAPVLKAGDADSDQRAGGAVRPFQPPLRRTGRR
jgi:hypothetical protein